MFLASAVPEPIYGYYLFIYFSVFFLEPVCSQTGFGLLCPGLSAVLTNRI